MNKYLKTGLIFAFILALILIPTYCGLKQLKETETPKTVISDNTQQVKEESRSNFVLDSIAKVNKRLAILNDSILKLKIKYVKGRDRVHDSLIYISDSTCRQSLNILYFECQKVDSVNNWLISTKNERIKNDSIESQEKENKIIAKQKRINRDSTYIEHLHNDSIPQVKRKALWKGRGQGAAAYAIIREGINVVSKLKP